jgi:two-component system sensor histidine kinase ChvG
MSVDSTRVTIADHGMSGGISRSEHEADQASGDRETPKDFMPDDHLPDKPKKSLLSRSFKNTKRLLFSSLTRRIVIFNMAALAILLATILYMNQFREGLTDAKIESLLAQGRIIAGAIAGSATANTDAITIDPEKLIELKEGESLMPRLDPLDNLQFPINPEQVAPVLRALIKPTQTRARIYDPDGILILDSRFLYDAGQIQRFDLPPLDGTTPVKKRRVGWAETIGNMLNRLLNDPDIPLYKEYPGSGMNYPEVQSALTGAPRPIVRLTEKGRLTVSVAVPVQRFRAVLGVLLLSTEGDSIDRIVRDERLEILRIFLVAAVVMFVLSALLAGTIASPLRKLSEAAMRVKRGVKSRVGIPDMSHRNDEIGNLSGSIADMTNSLYSRIEAIERFAADVSHELKNPLTSLRSAVETLPLVKNEESRDRLLEVILHDVKRLNRLITDISDASRLDADLVRDTADRVDMKKLLEDIVGAAQAMTERRKKVSLELKIASQKTKSTHYYVSGHDVRLGQVVNNLIDNAISFVPENSGLVSVLLDSKNGQLSLIIQDNGPGIQAEDPNRVFERFYTDRAETDGFGQNSGLGLSISQQIIEAHGGTICAENRKGETTGARFIVSLPLDTVSRRD